MSRAWTSLIALLLGLPLALPAVAGPAPAERIHALREAALRFPRGSAEFERSYAAAESLAGPDAGAAALLELGLFWNNLDEAFHPERLAPYERLAAEHPESPEAELARLTIARARPAAGARPRPATTTPGTGAHTIPRPGGAPPYTVPPDPATFAPTLRYRADHREFALRDNFDRDENVENNREDYLEQNHADTEPGGNLQAPRVYTNVTLDRDTQGDPFWAVEFHYYYAKNLVQVGTDFVQTHEHDWEWIYVVVLEEEGAYRAHAATLSSHDAENHATFNAGKYFFFPGEGTPELALAAGPRLVADVGNDGNAFANTVLNPLAVESVEILATHRNLAFYRYGDPANWRFGGSSTSENGDARPAPWERIHWLDPFPETIDVPATPGPPGAAVTQLLPNAPNPFTGATAIRFELASATPIELAIYDAAGRRVRRLASGLHAPGPHSRSWDGTNDAGRLMPSGIYAVRLEAGGGTSGRTIVLLR